jgi:hypothetical protein
MPFIYQDLQLEVLNDFVESKLSSLDSLTLESQQRSVYDVRSAIDKMRDYRRGLFLGEGGIGKTTFFRFATLNIMGATVGKRITNNSESTIPFFVPLKALDNASDHPLLYALIDNNPYLGKNRRRAIGRLIKLTRSRGAAFFLDGFDEIPYAGGNQSLIQELSALFSPFDEAITGTLNRSKYADFYKQARGCRVYLSSRREFFLAHAINAPRDVPRWEITGLTDKRSILVGNVFRHYKNESASLFSDTLNVEEFMRQLSLSKDQGFEQLSSNPLFLTVLCFVYVNEIRLGGLAGDMFNQSSSNLVERCIRLLLSGIDKAKTAGLSPIDAKALMHRRSAWPDQKLSGLQYVASHMYVKNLASLTLDNLISLLTTFFRSNSQIADVDAILLGLSKSDPLANMAIQLTLSGVLVVVDRRDSQTIYDFPHRRFKEMLAVSYFTTTSGIDQLKSRINDPSFYELSLLVAGTPAGWLPVVDALKASLSTKESESAAKLLLQVLAKAGASADATKVAKSMLDMAIRGSAQKVSLPKKLLVYLPRGSSYEDTLLTLLRATIQCNDTWGFSLIAEALVAITDESPSGAIDDIQGLLPDASKLDWQLLDIVNNRDNQNGLKKCMTWLLSKRSAPSINDSISGVLFVALVGQAMNRVIVQTCLRLWLQRLGDPRVSFFEADDRFDEVIDVYATTSALRENKAKRHFSRGHTPKIQHPWH